MAGGAGFSRSLVGWRAMPQDIVAVDDGKIGCRPGGLARPGAICRGLYWQR